MAVPMVPTLGSQTFLTDIPSILLYQLRQYITMPKNRSDLYTDDIISYMDDMSRISYDKHSMADLVKMNLTTVYNRIFKDFPKIKVEVDVIIADATGNQYQLEIGIKATDGTNTWYSNPSILNDRGIPLLKNDTVALMPVE